MKRNPVGVGWTFGACRTITCLLLAGLVSTGQQMARRESLSDWKLVRTLQLEGETFHVQGVDSDGEHVWVTSCDRAGRKAFLHRFSMASGALEQAIDITDGIRYHPGGIDSDATSIWVPSPNTAPQARRSLSGATSARYRSSFGSRFPTTWVRRDYARAYRWRELGQPELLPVELPRRVASHRRQQIRE